MPISHRLALPRVGWPFCLKISKEDLIESYRVSGSDQGSLIESLVVTKAAVGISWFDELVAASNLRLA